MTIQVRLKRFLGKPRHDQIKAVQATLEHLLRRRRAARAERQLRGPFGPARVLPASQPLYLAYRPDTDVAADEHPELPALLDGWLHGNFANNAGDLVRLYALVFNIKQVLAEGVPGDCAELGVYRGNSASVIAHYARLAGRSTYLFDTFEGFVRAEVDVTESEAVAGAFDDTSLEDVARVVGTDSVVFCKGYFPESIPPGLHDRMFCFVHVDCDLFEPARAALEFFYPRLHPGGMLILHDYAHPGWTGIRRAADAFLAGRPERLVVMPDKSGSAVLRKV